MDESDIRLEQWKIEVEKRLTSGDEKFNNIMDTLREIKINQKEANDKLDALQQVPGKRWDGMINSIVSSVIGAAITAAVAFMALFHK